MTAIFVGNLPTEIDEETLQSHFSKHGQIACIRLKVPSRPPAFAFIEYEESSGADNAVRESNGIELLGSKIRVEISRSGPNQTRDTSSNKRFGTQYRVTVSNLSSKISWQDLKDFFRRGGDVVHTNVDHSGSGVGSFATYDEMERAIRKLDRVKLDGRTVRVRRERSNSRSNARSRSPSRSRSRSSSRSKSPSPARRKRRSNSRSKSRSRSRTLSRRTHRRRSRS
uniref:Splicing factor putative n=1 Tax=Albugo laibachii Nc14 TaxID=890382 RepID=F0W7R9_9STRA|nr:splicing factor putative [Albugo laibachii Nc14]|eukprot:CCA17171.1 splicing factor putative [Albugo laibachii Nc14]